MVQTTSAVLFTYCVFVPVVKMTSAVSTEGTGSWLYGRGAARVPPTQTNALNSSWESMMTNEFGERNVSKSGIQRKEAVEEEEAVHAV